MDIVQLIVCLPHMLEDLNSALSTNEKQTALAGSQEDTAVRGATSSHPPVTAFNTFYVCAPHSGHTRYKGLQIFRFYYK